MTSAEDRKPLEQPTPPGHETTDDHETPDLDLLAAIGQVSPPDPGVLDAAREVLWSAVAQEVLSVPPADPRPRTMGERKTEPRYREHPDS
jgi:hypothetical protein